MDIIGIIGAVTILGAGVAGYKILSPHLPKRSLNEKKTGSVDNASYENSAKLRYEATALKKQKRFLEAAEKIKQSTDMLFTCGMYPGIVDIMRHPKYLVMAEKFEDAAMFCIKVINEQKKYIQCSDQRDYDYALTIVFSVLCSAFEGMGNHAMYNASFAAFKTAQKQQAIHPLRRNEKPSSSSKNPIRGIPTLLKGMKELDEKTKSDIEYFIAVMWSKINIVTPIDVYLGVGDILHINNHELNGGLKWKQQ